MKKIFMFLFIIFGIFIASNVYATKNNVVTYTHTQSGGRFGGVLDIINLNSKGFDFSINVTVGARSNLVEGYANFISKNKAIYKDSDNPNNNITFIFNEDNTITVKTKNCDPVCLEGNYIKGKIDIKVTLTSVGLVPNSIDKEIAKLVSKNIYEILTYLGCSEDTKIINKVKYKVKECFVIGIASETLTMIIFNEQSKEVAVLVTSSKNSNEMEYYTNSKNLFNIPHIALQYAIDSNKNIIIKKR